MSHSQFHSIKRLYLDMHGLIFETSVWLLAESTRLLSWRVFLMERRGYIEYNFSLPLKKYMSFNKSNFTYSITRIYCNTNAAQIKYKNNCIQTGNNTCNKAQLSFQKPLFTYSGWSKHELRLNKRIISPILTNSSHMSTLFARYTRWTPDKLISGINHLVSRTNY